MAKQSQKSGDSSTNFQTESMVVNVGIDEKRAREVFHEMNLQLRDEYTHEALELANARVREFENRLMPKMDQVEGALDIFSDPSFQLLLVEAQKRAASTERTADYDLLSELLIHRFEKGDDRVARAGIGFAVDIVDKISDEALLGLTVTHAVMQFSPLSGDIYEGLDILDKLFSKVIYGDLPAGQEWIDHLDILRAIRINPVSSLIKTKEYYCNMLSGYIDVGIKKDSENFKRAVEIIDKNGLPRNLLFDHSFNEEFSRVPVANIAHTDDLVIKKPIEGTGGQFFHPVALTEEQKAAVESIYELYSKDVALKQRNVDSLMTEWDKRPNLKLLREWWDSIPMGLSITSAGKVLAHSNAQRCDKSLPPLN